MLLICRDEPVWDRLSVTERQRIYAETLKLSEELTARGLVIIMIGATVITLVGGDVAAVISLVVGLLAAFVVYGRWPGSGRSER
jgi:hypothetical protein